jgi:DNA-binding Xre family transcriptional regulator
MICKLEVRIMRISYRKLWIKLAEKEIAKVTLRKDLNIATGTMTKLRRNEEVALSVLLRICEYLDCNIGDICDAVRIETTEEEA